MLEGYGAIPCMFRIMSVFWDHQEFVTRQNGYHSPHFKSTWWTTQGGIILPILFNFVVNILVSNWLALMVEYQLVAHKVLGFAVGRCMGLLYADNSVVGIAGSRVASGRTERDHQHFPPVRTGSKCRKVQGHDIPYGSTQVQDV